MRSNVRQAISVDRTEAIDLSLGKNGQGCDEGALEQVCGPEEFKSQHRVGGVFNASALLLKSGLDSSSKHLAQSPSKQNINLKQTLVIPIKRRRFNQKVLKEAEQVRSSFDG